jgi:hypothetical protein
MAGTHEVTRLLESWRGGNEAALGELLPIVHDELRRIARRALRGEHHRATDLRLDRAVAVRWPRRTTRGD